jgi:hypothetical protein
VLVGINYFLFIYMYDYGVNYFLLIWLLITCICKTWSFKQSWDRVPDYTVCLTTFFGYLFSTAVSTDNVVKLAVTKQQQWPSSGTEFRNICLSTASWYITELFIQWHKTNTTNKQDRRSLKMVSTVVNYSSFSLYFLFYHIKAKISLMK